MLSKLVSPSELVPIRKASKAELTAIEALAKKIEPALAEVIAAHLKNVAEGVSLKALITALEEGNIIGVIDALAAIDTAATSGAVSGALQDAVWAGGALGAAGVNASLKGASFAFNKLNPTLVTFLQGYSLKLIREIDLTTKEAIRDALVQGMTDGKNPTQKTARVIRESIGLTKRQAAAVKAYRKELETFHERTSAKGYNIGGKIDRVNGRQVFRPGPDGKPLDGITQRRLRDFRYDGALARAMKTGKPIPPEKIDKMVSAYARKYRRHRSMNIARTESLRASNYGVQEAWRQAIEEGKVSELLVRRSWVVSKDERLCEVCSPIPKMNGKGVPFGDPFKTPNGPVMLPPIHPSCRCTVFIRTFTADQLGLGDG